MCLCVCVATVLSRTVIFLTCILGFLLFVPFPAIPLPPPWSFILGDHFPPGCACSLSNTHTRDRALGGLVFCHATKVCCYELVEPFFSPSEKWLWGNGRRGFSPHFTLLTFSALFAKPGDSTYPTERCAVVSALLADAPVRVIRLFRGRALLAPFPVSPRRQNRGEKTSQRARHVVLCTGTLHAHSR